MKTFVYINETSAYLAGQRDIGKKIGFVPTMGALHEGHLELIRAAKRKNDVVACSIFVNPIQFNNPKDLEKYPRTLKTDQALLEGAGCNLLFAPSVEEMYPESAKESFDFGDMEKVMEGAFRPGHFNGVAVVVGRLFDIVGPCTAYFGEKDFQQLAIIRKLVEMEKLPVSIVGCPTVREIDGLAMSSRNRRLTAEERDEAPFIYQVLNQIKDDAATMGVEEARKKALKRLEAHSMIRPEYLEVVNSETLMPATSWSEQPAVVACVAAFLGAVRLIDNIILFSNFAARKNEL